MGKLIENYYIEDDKDLLEMLIQNCQPILRDLLNQIEKFNKYNQIEKFSGKIFNAGGGLQSSASLLEMTKICEKISGNKINIDAEVQNRPADLKVYVTNNAKIIGETGWQPKKSVENIFSDIYYT